MPVFLPSPQKDAFFFFAGGVLLCECVPFDVLLLLILELPNRQYRTAVSLICESNFLYLSYINMYVNDDIVRRKKMLNGLVLMTL